MNEKTKSGALRKKSWREKRDKPQQPEIVEVGPNSPKAWGQGTMIIVTPKLIDNLVREIPKGSLLTIGEMRAKFARDFNTDTTCPLTTGIFLRICAEAAEEGRSEGEKDISPYWRVIRDSGEMIDKFPGSVEAQAEKLKNEGHEILITDRKGSRLIVGNYADSLLSL